MKNRFFNSLIDKRKIGLVYFHRYRLTRGGRGHLCAFQHVFRKERSLFVALGTNFAPPTKPIFDLRDSGSTTKFARLD